MGSPGVESARWFRRWTAVAGGALLVAWSLPWVHDGRVESSWVPRSQDDALDLTRTFSYPATAVVALAVVAFRVAPLVGSLLVGASAAAALLLRYGNLYWAVFYWLPGTTVDVPAPPLLPVLFG